ncbi:MAG: hypothetical protein J5545_11965 [Bacteroidaceae bacterium]|nr:hypothetical protein [Bacteroidaceae bacterium]
MVENQENIQQETVVNQPAAAQEQAVFALQRNETPEWLDDALQQMHVTGNVFDEGQKLFSHFPVKALKASADFLLHLSNKIRDERTDYSYIYYLLHVQAHELSRLKDQLYFFSGYWVDYDYGLFLSPVGNHLSPQEEYPLHLPKSLACIFLQRYRKDIQEVNATLEDCAQLTKDLLAFFETTLSITVLPCTFDDVKQELEKGRPLLEVAPRVFSCHYQVPYSKNQLLVLNKTAEDVLCLLAEVREQLGALWLTRAELFQCFLLLVKAFRSSGQGQELVRLWSRDLSGSRPELEEALQKDDLLSPWLNNCLLLHEGKITVEELFRRRQQGQAPDYFLNLDCLLPVLKLMTLFQEYDERRQQTHSSQPPADVPATKQSARDQQVQAAIQRLIDNGVICKPSHYAWVKCGLINAGTHQYIKSTNDFLKYLRELGFEDTPARSTIDKAAEKLTSAPTRPIDDWCFTPKARREDCLKAQAIARLVSTAAKALTGP